MRQNGKTIVFTKTKMWKFLIVLWFSHAKRIFRKKNNSVGPRCDSERRKTIF